MVPTDQATAAAAGTSIKSGINMQKWLGRTWICFCSSWIILFIPQVNFLSVTESGCGGEERSKTHIKHIKKHKIILFESDLCGSVEQFFNFFFLLCTFVVLVAPSAYSANGNKCFENLCSTWFYLSWWHTVCIGDRHTHTVGIRYSVDLWQSRVARVWWQKEASRGWRWCYAASLLLFNCCAHHCLWVCVLWRKGSRKKRKSYIFTWFSTMNFNFQQVFLCVFT